MKSMVLSAVSSTVEGLWAEIGATLAGLLFHTHEGVEWPPELHEVKLSLFFMAFFGVLRKYIFGKLMVEKLGAYLGVLVDTIALKLVNQWISLGMHIFSVVWGLMYLPHEKWFADLLQGRSEVLYEGLLQGAREMPMSIPFKAFYNVHLGYQLHALHFTVQENSAFPADRRADYRQMLVHHVIAVSLIFWSYVLGYSRIGVLVMVSHNASDIMVCITKSAKLLGWTQASLFLLPVMIITWLVTRLLFFPFYVLNHVSHIPTSQLPYLHQLTFHLCYCGLLILLFLNLFWFFKFLQMAANAIVFGNSIDVTESKVTNDMAENRHAWHKQQWWEG